VSTTEGQRRFRERVEAYGGSLRANHPGLCVVTDGDGNVLARSGSFCAHVEGQTFLSDVSLHQALLSLGLIVAGIADVMLADDLPLRLVRATIEEPTDCSVMSAARSWAARGASR
jgi:hypothetical protein